MFFVFWNVYCVFMLMLLMMNEVCSELFFML